MFKINDIVIPKSKWLDLGEIAKPAIVLDAWWDKELKKQKITVLNVDEAEQIANKTLIGFPHSRMDTFAEYYDLYEE